MEDMMRFIEGQFTPTQWDDPRTKKLFAEKLVDFVEGGFDRKKFTSALYHRLCQMFRHIAHTNIDGFYGVWFSTPENQAKWVEYILRVHVYGDPAYTWSDVEAVFKNWLMTSSIPAKMSREAECYRMSELKRIAIQTLRLMSDADIEECVYVAKVKRGPWQGQELSV
jgi:hypothetical protein